MEMNNFINTYKKSSNKYYKKFIMFLNKFPAVGKNNIRTP